jgi:uncharacterized protein with beta-barrel porin domain
MSVCRRQTVSVRTVFRWLWGEGTFIVDGPRAASDAARIEAGSNLYVTRNVAFFGNFIGEYSNRTSSNAGNGGLRVTW